MKSKDSQKIDEFIKQLKQWKNEVECLRVIIQKTGVTEALKWRLPCYCVGEANISIIQPFKKCLGLMFFKGVLVTDSKGLLVSNGPNSQSAKRLEFTSVAQIKKHEPVIKKYIKEAIAIEKRGLKVSSQKKMVKPYMLLQELKGEFNSNPKLKEAFYSLTPGRQRAYILYFSNAKQSSTRESRIKKYSKKILAKKGIND